MYNKLKNQLKSHFQNQDDQQGSNLILSRCNITMDQLQVLRRLDLANLKQLWLDRNRIGDQWLKIISDVNLPSLTQLYLHRNFIRSNGAKFIVNIYMPKLRILYIDENYLGNQGLNTLTKSQWPQLFCLKLCLNDITEDGLTKLQNGNWQGLHYLYLGKNKMEVAAALNLAACECSQIKMIQFSQPCVFVNNPPRLVPTHQYLQQTIKSALPKHWGLQFRNQL